MGNHIAQAISQGDLLDIIQHQNQQKYPNQKIFIIKMNSLEPEEKNLLNSVENQEWESIANLTQAVDNYREFAQNHITRLAETPISITLDPDVAKVFKTSELVNQVLRVIMKKNLSVSLEETES